MDKKKFDKIIKLENTIASMYYNLYKLEISNDKSGCIYSHYINSLKDALKQEEKNFKGLNVNELLNFSLYIRDNTKKINGNFSSCIFNTYISDRICERIKKYMLQIPITNKGLNSSLMKEFKNKNEILYIVFEEQNNIYLSFLDEYINKEKDNIIKKELTFAKYGLIFISDTDYERQMINKEFTIDSSLYIDTDIKACLKNFSLNEISNAKREISASEVYKCIEEFASKNLSSKVSYAENIGFLVKIRTYCLLMDGDTFKSFISVFTVTPAISNMINNLFDIDILDVLNKDRERHKYLSLKRK